MMSNKTILKAAHNDVSLHVLYSLKNIKNILVENTKK